MKVERVKVLGEQTKQQPVAEIGRWCSVQHGDDSLHLQRSTVQVEDQATNRGAEGGQQAVEKDQTAEEGEQVEPEPEKEVDLLAENVHRKEAHGVEAFNAGRRAELVELALGDARKETHHWTVLQWPGGRLAEGEHLPAVVEELPTQQPVHEHHLREDVHQIEQLADDVAQVQLLVEGASRAAEELREKGDVLLLCRRRLQNGLIQAEN